MNKKILTISAIVITLAGLGLWVYFTLPSKSSEQSGQNNQNASQEQIKKDLEDKTKSFIEKWGNHTKYNSYKEYITALRPNLTDDFYNKLIKNSPKTGFNKETTITIVTIEVKSIEADKASIESIAFVKSKGKETKEVLRVEFLKQNDQWKVNNISTIL